MFRAISININNKLIYTDVALKEALIIHVNSYCTEHGMPFEQIYLDRN